MQTTKYIYNIFSGTYLQIPNDDIKSLHMGQIPLKNNPNYSCKKCYGKGHIGKDSISYTYQLCTCVHKNIDIELIKKE
jgi:hypothetical protein